MKFVQKYRFLTLMLFFFRLEGGELGHERCKGGFSNGSGTKWENPLLRPWENEHFSKFSPVFHFSIRKPLVFESQILRHYLTRGGDTSIYISLYGTCRFPGYHFQHKFLNGV